jgi:LuxR family maltose regulon positive regulatory protein
MDLHHRPVPVQGGIVRRRALFERLGRAARVTQISAPAGSGKTVLIRSWTGEAALEANTAWVSAQDQERDPPQFWISVSDALRDTIAGSKLVRPLTAAPDLDGWVIVERLLKDLVSLEEHVWLMVDDLHELGDTEMRQLELLVMRAPAELRFVLSTRRDLRLGLHRLRLEGELTEIRAAHLRFTPEEARVLFEAAGADLSGQALALLHERTEGWAAGLRLAALSLAGCPDPERFVAEFSGSERTVADYLLAEVLDRQPAPARSLLLRTSVLERVSGELADLLTGGSGAERILQDLEEAGAFVVALDTRRSWFRYHRLFADLLQLELRRTEPTELAAVHGAAAGWFAKHGYPVEAVRHALSAQDWELAARLMSDHFLGLVLDGQGATAHELLGRFPGDVAAADPKLAVLMAADELQHRSLDRAEHHLAHAARGTTSVPADGRRRFQVNLAIMRLFLSQRRGDLPAVTKEAQRLLAPAEPADAVQSGLGEDLRALALVSLGAAELWALRAEEAERHLEQGSAIARRIGQPWLEVGGLAHAAWAASFRSFALAVKRSSQAIELAREHGWTEEPVVAAAYAVLGAIRIWQMRLDEAEVFLEQAARALQAEVEPAAGLVLHHARGMLKLARGRDADALDAFRTAERLAGSLVTGHPRTTPMRAHMLQTLVRLGDSERAEAILGAVDETGHGETRNALAALRLVQRDPQAAAAALAPVLDGSAPVTNPGWMTQAFLLEAIARDALGDTGLAARALEHALDLAEAHGAIFAFALHPAPELLERHARHGTPHAALIAEVLAMLAGSKREPAPGEPVRLREPLTESETRVLRYLPTNLSVPEIAAELLLSPNTVRTHIRHLYEKLGAHRRTEAVEQARALGLPAQSRRS